MNIQYVHIAEPLADINYVLIGIERLNQIVDFKKDRVWYTVDRNVFFFQFDK